MCEQEARGDLNHYQIKINVFFCTPVVLFPLGFNKVTSKQSVSLMVKGYAAI